jgi:hypothetical protein
VRSWAGLLLSNCHVHRQQDKRASHHRRESHLRREKPDADAIERLEEAMVGGKRVLVSLDETTRIPVEPSIPIIIRAVCTTTMGPLG